VPAEVVGAVSEYQAAQDNIARFIAERCTPARGAWVSSDEIHSAYRDACQAAGEYWKPKEAFGERLRAAGFLPQKRGGRRGWAGVTVSNSWANDAADAAGHGFPVNGSIDSPRGPNGETVSTVSSASFDEDFT
jgi:phage/plasmid-associated DNA primase